MDEGEMNDLQVIFEQVVETYIGGAGPVLYVSKDRNNLSGFNLNKSLVRSLTNEGKNRYDNDSSDLMNENDCDSSRDVENMSNSSFSVIINDKLKKTNGHNRRRSSYTKNIILTISQGELNAIDQERNKLIQSVAHLEEQNNLLRLQNEELIAQIDTGEEQKKNIVDEVAHLRTSLVVTNTVATEL